MSAETGDITFRQAKQHEDGAVVESAEVSLHLAREERFQELKKQFVAARDVIRSLGGDVSTDNPYLKDIT